MAGLVPANHVLGTKRKSWMPGTSPGMTSMLVSSSLKHSFAISRLDSPEVCFEFPALRNQRAQGKPGARCTRGLVCKLHKEMRTRAYRFSGSIPAFPAQWFTAYFVLSSVNGLFCHRRRAEVHLHDLAPASGRQNHTTSPSASAPFVKGTSTSTASHRTFRDDREPPLFSGETCELIAVICPTG